MTTALIPVKALAGAKTRLASVLSPAFRQALCLAMLEDVVGAARAARRVEQVVVLAADRAALRLATRLGVQTLPEPPGLPGLNEALALACRTLAAAGARAVLVLPMDVPLADPADIDALCAVDGAPAVALCPAADGGTNALLLAPPTVIAPAFGPGSAALHAHQAAAAGVTCRVLDLPSLRLDVDGPADLDRVLAAGKPTKTAQVLAAGALPVAAAGEIGAGAG